MLKAAFPISVSTDVNTPNVKTDPSFANLLKPMTGVWMDKNFIENWNENMKGGNTKVGSLAVHRPVRPHLPA